MAIDKHLEAVTYWEKRCALQEGVILKLGTILGRYIQVPAFRADLQALVYSWDQALIKLGSEHPAPPETKDAPAEPKPIAGE